MLFHDYHDFEGRNSKRKFSPYKETNLKLLSMINTERYRLIKLQDVAHNVSPICNASIFHRLDVRVREQDRRTLQFLFARSLSILLPPRMHACNVVKVARLKLQRSAVISRRLQCRAFSFRDISAAENDQFKRLGAHRIKNNIGLTPRVTEIFQKRILQVGALESLPSLRAA